MPPQRRSSISNSELDDRLRKPGCELLERFSSEDPVFIRCLSCGNEWKVSYHIATSGSPRCPECFRTASRKRATRKQDDGAISNEERLENQRQARAKRYSEKVERLYGGRIAVVEGSYTGSKENVTLRCLVCGNEFRRRADHVVDKAKKCRCPHCSKFERGRDIAYRLPR